MYTGLFSFIYTNKRFDDKDILSISHEYTIVSKIFLNICDFLNIWRFGLAGLNVYMARVAYWFSFKSNMIDVCRIFGKKYTRSNISMKQS